MMLPNTDVDQYDSVASWWPDSVKGESEMATFLELIEVPALDRKKAYLAVPNKIYSDVTHKLPVMISSSFVDYAEKLWLISGKIGIPSSYLCLGLEAPHWANPVVDLEEPIKPLINDLWKIAINGVYLNGDSRNFALTKNDEQQWAFRYFGLDFGEKKGNQFPPTEEKQKESSKTPPEKICNIVSYNLSEFLYSIAHDLTLTSKCLLANREEFCTFTLEKELSDKFANCDFILQAVGEESTTLHDEL